MAVPRLGSVGRVTYTIDADGNASVISPQQEPLVPKGTQQREAHERQQLVVPGPGTSSGSPEGAPQTKCSLCHGTGHPASRCPILARTPTTTRGSAIRPAREELFEDIVAVFPETFPLSGPRPGGFWPGVLPEFSDWVRRAKEEVDNHEGSRRVCTRCIPAHLPDFQAPVLLGSNGAEGLRRDGFVPLKAGRKLIVLFGTVATSQPGRDLKEAREEWIRSLEGAPIEVWLPSTESTEQHWAIVQLDRPKRLALNKLGAIGRSAFVDWMNVATPLVEWFNVPWIVSSSYAAILIGRSSLSPARPA